MDNKEWFRKAQYGMMIHFGLYSLLGGEYRGKRMGGMIGEWIQPYFRIPNAEYSKLAAVFNPIGFNADAWVNTAVDAGMKYLVVTTKHHEGFALYRSEADRFNVVDSTPFKRDIIGELADSCAKHGIKLGLYYSQALDWHEKNAGGWQECYGDNLGLPWANTWDYPDNTGKDFTEVFERKIKPQVKEILTQYGDICLIWFDTPMGISVDQSLELYNLVKKYQPDCLVNSRIGALPGVKFDYKSWADNEIPDEYQDGSMLFESPATLNDTWGYKAYDQNWKTPGQVAEIRNHLKERGINYLLNIGPDWLGRFPAPATDILKKAARL